MIKAIKYYVKTLVLPKYKYLNKFSIHNGDIIIDLGANVGEVTEFYARKKALVYSYEPNPHAFSILNRKFQHYKNVFLHNEAVSNYTGKAKLWLHENHGVSEIGFSQGSSLQADKINVGKEYIDVNVSHISDILANHKHIKLLKVDIEGGEYDIIDDILANADKIDHVLLETHGDKNPSFEKKEIELQQKISQSDYKEKFYTDWF